MHVLFYVGLSLWVLAAANLLGSRLGRSTAHVRALERVLKDSNAKQTAHRLRILQNRGDWRDPIERHLDEMIELWRAAQLLVGAAALYFFKSACT